MKPGLSLKKNLIISFFVFAFFAVLFIMTEKRGIAFIAAKMTYSVFLAAITFLIFHTNKISKWRALFFITSAVSFIIVFKFKLWGLTNNILVAPQKNQPEVPLCHIAIASNFAITFFDQLKSAVLYGWGKWGFYTAGVIYIFSTLSIGQGFCSWVCFYGGIDDGISKILPKQTLKVNAVPKIVRDFPMGLWIFLMLASLVLMEPVFCLWACPLKMTTALLNSGELAIYRLQTVVFLSVGAVFLLGLPLLTKKRTFCSFICPFGAFTSIAGQINPFKVTIDENECNDCGKCREVCPMLAITPENKVTNYCVKCGTCVDACPKGAIKFGIRSPESGVKEKGRKPGTRNPELGTVVRTFFVLSAIMFGGAISSFFVPDALVIILKLTSILK
jgi:ferredoxin-type protein NapH